MRERTCESFESGSSPTVVCGFLADREISGTASCAVIDGNKAGELSKKTMTKLPINPPSRILDLTLKEFLNNLHHTVELQINNNSNLQL